MSQGKYEVPKTKKKNAASLRKRKLALALSLVLILGAAIGGTMAYFTDNSLSGTSFSVGQVSCSVSQEGNRYIVTNEGNVPVYVRAAVVVNWVNENGVIQWTKPMPDIRFENSAWKEVDGYYYFQSVLDAKSTVNGPSVTVSEIPPTGFSPKIQFLVEAIQQGAAQEAWGYSPSGK